MHVCLKIYFKFQLRFEAFFDIVFVKYVSSFGIYKIHIPLLNSYDAVSLCFVQITCFYSVALQFEMIEIIEIQSKSHNVFLMYRLFKSYIVLLSL